MSSMADWFIGLLYIVFIIGVIGYAYYEIRKRMKKKF